ncbi:hypothetical protein D0T53_01845 [Dysgonomonas sp. 216]|nr:hypothetical protein [Dysgonomonas sp. 216]
MKEKSVYICLFIYSFILLFFCTESSPLYYINQWADVNIYFNIGKTMLNGQVLYQDIFDHKGPLIFFIYSIGYTISNNSFLGIFILSSLFLFIGLCYVYLTARLFLNNFLSVIVSFIFSLFILTNSYSGGSAEEFIVMLLAVSLYYFIKYFNNISQKPNKKILFIQGFIFATILFIKINLISFFFFPLLIIALFDFYNKNFKNFLSNITYFTLGMSLITIPLILYFIFNNAFNDFIFGYFEFNMLYSNLKFDFHFVLGLLVKFWHLCIKNPVFIILIITGILSFTFSDILKNKWLKSFVILSSIPLFITILAVPYMLDYYYLPLTIYVSFGLIYILKFINEKVNLKLSVLCILPLFITSIIIGCIIKGFFGNDIINILKRDTEQTNNVIGVFSEEITKSCNRTLIILGLNKSIAIFTKDNIMPNTKYFFYPNIAYESYPLIRNTQEEYIKNKSTQFIILSDINLYYTYFKESDILKDNYDIVKTVKENTGNSYYLYKKK